MRPYWNFTQHTDLAERSAYCKHCYKQIYTNLFVDDHFVGFIRHDMYLELWEGNYLTKTAQVNLTWDAVSTKIAELIEQGKFIVPIKAAPALPQMEQLTLTPEDSEKVGLPSQEQQTQNIELAAEVKKWSKPIIDASGKYITEQDITDALCNGSGFEDGKFRIQQYFSARVLPLEEDQARWLKKNTVSAAAHGISVTVGAAQSTIWEKILKLSAIRQMARTAAF